MQLFKVHRELPKQSRFSPKTPERRESPLTVVSAFDETKRDKDMEQRKLSDTHGNVNWYHHF